ncbi:MAG: hypothetical protein HDR14_14745 [Lachnospiraceae bacterium]|nr:hypothetical protein [Lachnospiraceae bacterium]
MKRKFLTRAGAALLSVVLVFSCVLSRPAALNARAASLALGEAAANEMSMVLWNLLMNCLVACGVEASFGDYGMEVAFFTAYLNEISISDDIDSNITFTLTDGSKVSLRQLMGDNTVGTGALQIPDEATWQRFRVIDGGGSGSSDPDNDPEFTHLASFAMNAGVLLGISKFIGALQDGKIEGIDPADYFPDGFDGTLDQDAEGNYIMNATRLIGTLYQIYNGQPVGYKVISDLQGLSNPYPVVAYFDMVTIRTDCPEVGCIYFMQRRTLNEIVHLNVPASVIYYRPSGVTSSNANSISYYVDPNTYSFNIPVFSNRAAAELFLKTGEFTGCENALDYDYAALLDALPDNFAPLTGTDLNPSVFNSLFPALLSAIQSAFPQPQPNPDPDADPEPVPLPDPVAGTEVFNKVVSDTATDVAADAAPDPEPNPNPDVDIDVGSYEVDLTYIFPFCLPFDFIRLLDALDAEPVTPVFEFPFVVPSLDIDITVTLDMSFLKPVMEVFRMGETVGFIILLIVLTQRVIKW